MENQSPTATVVIATRNRKEELRGAIQSALDQDAQPEVLVIDDGSTDGTSEMVGNEFGDGRVSLHFFPDSRGYIARRNYGAHVAKAPYIFSLDDDACFSSKTVISDTLKDFKSEVIGAVAIPFINVKQDAQVHQLSPDSGITYVTYTYVGTAHALRRDLFLKLGGYSEYLIHQGEEEDFAIRLMDAGYSISFGTSETISHFESPKRSFERMDYFGRRNQILFAVLRVPLPCIAPHLTRILLVGLRQMVKTRRIKSMGRGMVAGFRDGLKLRGSRQPVRLSTYLEWMRLRRLSNQGSPMSRDSQLQGKSQP